MRILERYIMKSVVGIFCACLLSFLFLYIIIDLFSHLETILKQHTSLAILINYYLLNIPIIFVQVVPITFLLATLYTFARLNRDNEIIAMRASGLSILSITRGVLVLGCLMSVLVFWVNDRKVPSALLLTEKIKASMEDDKKLVKEHPQNEVVRDLTMYGLKNRLFYVGEFHPATNTMENITVLEHNDRQDLVKKIVAKKGTYENGFWTFYQCITYNYDERNQEINEPQYFEEQIMPITDSPEDFLEQRQRTEYMTAAQLDNYIRRLSTSGANSVIRNLKVDLYQRFSFPFTSIVIILLGIPFAFMIQKRATGLSSLGVSLMLGFLYYVINAISIALGKQGILPPLLSATLSQILAFSLSVYLLATRR